MKRSCLIAFALLAIAPVRAQETDPAPAAAPPACADEKYRQFDFWLGEWEVFTEQGQKVGDNAITKEEKGCLLVERWTDINGNTGQSYNFVDLAIDKWRQVWVSPGVVIDYTGGASSVGVMTLEGAVTSAGQAPQQFRGTWSLQEDGTVRQHLRNFDPEKEEWAEGFVGIYKKKTAE